MGMRWFFAKALVIPVLVLAPLTAVSAPPKDTEPDLAQLAGRWTAPGDSRQCSNEFEFSTDERELSHFIHGPIDSPAHQIESMLDVAKYDVVDLSPRIRVRHSNLPGGPLWELVLIAPDRLCWRQADDPPGSCARVYERCE